MGSGSLLWIKYIIFFALLSLTGSIIPTVFGQESSTTQDEDEGDDGFSPAFSQLVLTFLITGGIIAGSYEWIRYFFNKRRENAFEITKVRMERLRTFVPTYVKVAMYFRALESEFGKPNPDRLRGFFYICKILRWQAYLFENGGVLLDDLDAEEALSSIYANSQVELIKEFGYRKIGEMQALALRGKSYHSFCEEVERDYKMSRLCNEMADWLQGSQALPSIVISDKREAVTRFLQHGVWYADLLILEVNIVFRHWYRKMPPFEMARDEKLRDLLVHKLKKEDYYNRLLSLESGRFYRPIDYHLKILLILSALSLFGILVGTLLYVIMHAH